MSTSEELLMESQQLMFDAIFGKPEPREDNRSQDEARNEYLRYLNDDQTADLIGDIVNDSALELADLIIEGDAIAILRLFERAIDRVMDR